MPPKSKKPIDVNYFEEEVMMLSSIGVKRGIVMYMFLTGKRASALPGATILTPRIALTLKFVLPAWESITAQVAFQHPKIFGRLLNKIKRCLENR